MSDCEQLKRELAETKSKLAEAKKKIDQLEDMIKRVELLNTAFLKDCWRITDNKNGVPRGEWSYAKGQGTAAASTLNVIGKMVVKPTVKPRVFKMKLFKSGLFRK